MFFIFKEFRSREAHDKTWGGRWGTGGVEEECGCG